MYMTFRKILGLEHTFLDQAPCEDLLPECQFMNTSECKKDAIKKYCPKLCGTCGKNKHFYTYGHTFSYVLNTVYTLS